jgi:hypothetical protein
MTFPRDLYERQQTIDDYDAWARDIVEAPTERDLGDLAGWAVEVTDRRTEDLPPENGDRSLHADVEIDRRATWEAQPDGLVARGRRRFLDRAARDERRVRSILYPSARSGLVVVSPLRPPVASA